ncbi:hypothetical protein EJ110_NYTH10250, partial [Nymphaea thermarum]
SRVWRCPQCVNVYETFSRVGKQLDEYYDWSKSVGIARSFEYPVIERVTPRRRGSSRSWTISSAINRHPSRGEPKMSPQSVGRPGQVRKFGLGFESKSDPIQT